MSTLRYPANGNTVGEVANVMTKFITVDIIACVEAVNRFFDGTPEDKDITKNWCSMELITEDGRAWGLDPLDRI